MNKSTTPKQKIFEPYSVRSQQVDTYDSVLESYLTNMQKTFVDGAHIMKAICDGNWDAGKPRKPVLSKIDLHKRDDTVDIVTDVNDN